MEGLLPRALPFRGRLKTKGLPKSTSSIYIESWGLTRRTPARARSGGGSYVAETLLLRPEMLPCIGDQFLAFTIFIFALVGLGAA